MYQISVFSKISNTSIQTLRYYDNLGLLKPKEVGEYNSYRYYTSDQLVKLKQIKKFKKMGFKLKEITNILNTYDEKFLILHKKKLQEEVDGNLKYIKEIEEIVTKMKDNKQDFQKELVNLISKEERRKVNMKENYNDARKKLLKGYEMYKNNNLADCFVVIEELKNDIFNTDDAIDPFWLNSAGDLFAGITFEVFKNNTSENVNFLNIFQFKINGKEIFDNLSEYIDTLDKDSYSHICLSGISSSPVDTQFSVVSVFKQKMKLFAMFEAKQ